MTDCTTYQATSGPDRGTIIVFPTGKHVSSMQIRKALGFNKDVLLERLKRSKDPAHILAPAGQNARNFQPATNWRAVLDALPAYVPPARAESRPALGWGWAS